MFINLKSKDVYDFFSKACYSDRSLALIQNVDMTFEFRMAEQTTEMLQCIRTERTELAHAVDSTLGIIDREADLSEVHISIVLIVVIETTLLNKNRKKL